MDDVLHEIALRIPPDQPDRLALASMLSKSWRRVITGQVFRDGYKNRHHSPPVLGYFCRGTADRTGNSSIRFVRILPRASVPYFEEQPAVPPGRWTLLDCRDGLLLSILFNRRSHDTLVIWDPDTGSHRSISLPARRCQFCAGAVVCSEKNQLKGEFKVIFVGSDDVEATLDHADAEGNNVTWASMYSSGTSSWSDIVTLTTPAGVLQPLIELKAPVLINQVLHFTLQDSQGILMYHTVDNTLSMIALPADIQDVDEDIPGIITSVSGNTLGYACLDDETVYIYSHVSVADEWKLDKSITFPRLSLKGLLCSVEGTSIVFAESDGGLFTINMDTYEAKQVPQEENLPYIMPYKWYCVPAGFKTGSASTVGKGKIVVGCKEEDSDDFGEGDDRSSEDDESDDEGDEERPNKAETLMKRAIGNLPTSGPEPGDKKGAVYAATHHPAKKARETSATDEKSSKSGGSLTCDLCTKTFNNLDAEEAHWDAKHKAAGK